MSALDGLYYTLLVTTGRIAARIRFSWVDRGPGQFRKGRRAWAPFFLPVANLYLRLTGAGLRVLLGREWLEYERAVYQQALSRPVKTFRDTLVTPVVPGVTLFDFLASRAPDSLKLGGLVAALGELHRLHGCRVNGDYLTHSDAATHNVLYEPKCGRAYWLDFESRHLERSLTWRRARDLLSFSHSAATALPPEAVELIPRALSRGYPDADVLRELADQAAGWRRRPVDLQLLQAPSSYRHGQHLEACLVSLGLESYPEG